MPSGSHTASRHVVVERHLGGAGQLVGGALDADVGVDPTPSDGCHRRIAVEAEPGGVSEQMPHRRASRSLGEAQRGIELEHAFLDGDHDRPRDHRLGQRGEPVPALGVADRAIVAAA